MGILQNLVVRGYQGAIIPARSRDNHLICGVTVKVAGEPGRFDHNFGSQRERLNPGIAEGALKPFV